MMYNGLDLDLPTIITPEMEKKVSEYEEQLRKEELEREFKRYKESGVPDKFFNESFDTFIAESEGEQHALDTVKEFAENPQNRVLILCGENGNGKSHLGCAVIRKCGGEYITSSMLCLKYDSAIGYKTEMTREQILNHYSKVSMLVIDECAKYFINTELEKFLLIQIICMRYENGLPTVLISNANKESFIKFLGKACFDRLTQVGTTITFNWESKRKSKR